MSPIVNTEVKMPNKMLQALTLHETFCIASGITSINAEQVKKFLSHRFDKNLSDQFKDKYLFNNQDS